MGEMVLQAAGVGMAYGGKQVLGGVDLSIRQGEICGLLGPNGAGKTTLLKILTGLVQPDSGEVLLFGRPLKPALLRRTGCLIGQPGLYTGRTAAWNLQVRQTLLGLPEDRVPAVLEQVGLADAAGERVSRFSQGMRQRLAIGMALMGNPDLLLLDEPVNSLDTQGMYDMRRLFRSLNEDHGVTILITSHLLDEVSRIATCYAFIQDSAIRQLSGGELRDQSRQYAEILTPDREKAAPVIESVVTEKGYEVMPDGSFRLYEALDCLPKINAALVEAGVAVHGLSLKTGTLADFYLAVTGGEGGGNYA